MGLLLAMLGQTVGFPVPEGGAGRLTQALAERLRARWGRDPHRRRGRPHRGRRTAARSPSARPTGSGTPPRRAVVADVLAPTLYERLLDASDVPDRVASSLRGFELDPGTVKVDWALDGPVPVGAQPPARLRARCTSPTPSRR